MCNTALACLKDTMSGASTLLKKKAAPWQADTSFMGLSCQCKLQVERITWNPNITLHCVYPIWETHAALHIAVLWAVNLPVFGTLLPLHPGKPKLDVCRFMGWTQHNIFWHLHSLKFLFKNNFFFFFPATPKVTTALHNYYCSATPGGSQGCSEEEQAFCQQAEILLHWTHLSRLQTDKRWEIIGTKRALEKTLS